MAWSASLLAVGQAGAEGSYVVHGPSRVELALRAHMWFMDLSTHAVWPENLRQLHMC